MAQPLSFANGQGSIPTPNGKDALVQLQKEKMWSRTSAYVELSTRWIMTLREREEFVSRRSPSFRILSYPSLPQNPDDYRIKDRLLYSGSIVWKKDNRRKGVSLSIYILNSHRT